MKKILVILAFVFSSSLFSQTLIQTYVDRCTGAVQVFSVPMNGVTVVTFYNKSRTFTYQEFQNGTLQAWLEETWLWWQALSPCSTTTTNVTTTTTQTQETVNQATEAATNATNIANQVNVPDTTIPDTTIPDTSIPDTSIPDTSVPDTSVPDTSVPDTSVPDTSVPDTEVPDTSVPDTSTPDTSTPDTSTPDTSTDTSTPDTSTDTGTPDTSTDTEVTDTSTTDTTETDNTTETTTDTNESTDTDTTETTESETTSTEDTAEAESTESETETTESESTESESDASEAETEETESDSEVEESTEESTEEESTDESENQESDEEQSEEESTEEEQSDEEESDESSEEDSEEESDEEESSEEESEEDEEESNEEESNDEDTEEEDKKREKRQFAPPVIMSNVLAQQAPTGEYNMAAMFGISQSTLIGTETFGANLMVYDNLEQFMLNLSYTKVHINDEGRANRVYSLGLGGSKMFTTYMGNINNSFIWLGKKGGVKGVAFGTSFTSFELDVRDGLIYYDDIMLSNSLTGFITKPYKWNDRLTISPMLAISSPFFSMSMSDYTTMWNTDVMAIGGMNFNYMFTKRFGLTLGTTVIESTIPQFPTLTNFMLGGRFSF